MSTPIDISRLNKHFGNPVKLGIMAALLANEPLSFNDLKEILGTSDGNLASHMYALQDLGYVSITKQFLGRKPNTLLSVTNDGRTAFNEHLAVLEEILRNQNP